MSISRIGAEITIDPEGAKKKILDAVEAAEGDRVAAAAALGTTHRSLYRFFNRLHLWDEIDALIAKKGFKKTKGPPRNCERIRNAVLAAEGDLAKASRALDMRIDVLREQIVELSLRDSLNRALARMGARRLNLAPSKAA